MADSLSSVATGCIHWAAFWSGPEFSCNRGGSCFQEGKWFNFGIPWKFSGILLYTLHLRWLIFFFFFLLFCNILCVFKQIIKRLLLNIKLKDIGVLISGSPGEDPKMLANFKDLLERIFVLDPEKRMTVSQALSHPFITGKWNKMLISECRNKMLIYASSLWSNLFIVI